MRLVLVLAILARELDTHIFQPTYLFEDDHVRDVLTRLASTESKKESFCRSVLLSIDPTTQARSLESRIQMVVKNVSALISDLLSKEQGLELQQGLEKIAQQAAAVWYQIQRIEGKYEPDFDPQQWDDAEWQRFSFPGGESEDTPDNEYLGENLLTVFPRICLVKDMTTREPQDYVVEVRNNQAACVAAAIELSESSKTAPHHRTASTRQRGQRVSFHNGDARQPGFLGEGLPTGVQSSG